MAGAGVYVPAPELAFEGSVWSVAEECGDARLERCRAFMPVPGPSQTVQRSEFWGAVIALQSCLPCHLGIDNLNVARSIGRLLDRCCLAKPVLSVKDGDWVALVQYMVQAWGRDPVRVTKVKGHATDEDVEHGRVRLSDEVGDADLRCSWMLGVSCSRFVILVPCYAAIAQVHDCCCQGDCSS